MTSDDLPRPTGADPDGEPLTYEEYLQVPQLLSLQVPRSRPPHHDEMLFIIIHQAYELWFKLILHELEFAIGYMDQSRVLRARHFVHRVVEIMRLLVSQIHILETMTPAEFLGFRDRLNPASGFQSIQFREIEFLCGLKDERYVKYFSSQPEQAVRLRARFEAPDLRSAYYAMLSGLGYETPAGFPGRALAPEEERVVLESLRRIYQHPEDADNLPLYLLSESLVSLDEHLGLWREHHVRVVARIIGSKPGTGGSSGVAYLQTTTGKRCFPYLWEVRTLLEKQP